MKELSDTKIKLLRGGIMLVIFLFIALIIYVCLINFLPGLFDVLKDGDQEEIEEYIRGFSSDRGLVLFFLLQFLQIISIIFPGMPIHIAGGAVFGTLIGFGVCHYGYVLANILVFFCSRKLGARMNKLLPLNGNNGKYDVLTRVRNPQVMVVVACLMPIVPNGLIPYLASKTRITYPQFFVCVYAGSLPTILVLSALGSNLLTGIIGGDYTVAIVIAALIALLLVLFFVFKKKIVALFNVEQRDAERNKADHTENETEPESTEKKLP